MTARPKKRPLLAPGNEAAEWAKINEERERQEVEFARQLSIPDRLEFGQELNDRAFSFYNAVRRDRGRLWHDSAGPDLLAAAVAANRSGLEYVAIGDLAVIAHGYLCTVRDSKLLVPDDSGVDEAILRSFNITKGGLPPLDFETVAANAIEVSWRDSSFRIASLQSLVGFKRLSGRPSDQVDLEKLERVNGELPIDPIPGLDDQH